MNIRYPSGPSCHIYMIFSSDRIPPLSRWSWLKEKENLELFTLSIPSIWLLWANNHHFSHVSSKFPISTMANQVLKILAGREGGEERWKGDGRKRLSMKWENTWMLQLLHFLCKHSNRLDSITQQVQVHLYCFIW